MTGKIEIRKPLTESDFEAMWSLNHDVFAEELKQHACRDNGLLIDKFHHKNIYYIAAHEHDIVGMISAHWIPPFSFDQKFSFNASRIYENDKIGEVRLLCVKKDYRKTSVAPKLLFTLISELRKSDINRVLISGLNEQKSLYEHIGFKAIGQPLQDGNAVFHPMSAHREDVLGNLKKILHRYEKVSLK